MRNLIIALLLLGAPLARAEDRSLARAHFMTGRSYYDQGRYAEALKEFQEAYRLSKRIGFLYNIGVCQEKLGQLDEALTAFQATIDRQSGRTPAE